MDISIGKYLFSQPISWVYLTLVSALSISTTFLMPMFAKEYHFYNQFQNNLRHHNVWGKAQNTGTVFNVNVLK